MSSTLPLQQRLRRLVPVMLVVLGLLLIGAVLIQQAVAQDSSSLKPPFKLNRTGSVSSFETHEPLALPLSAPIIMSQTFDSVYNPTTTLSAVGWHESFASGAISQYTWKYAGTVPFTDTVWCAGRWPAAQPPLYPATDNYTKGMQALLIYGPLDLAEYTQLVMTGTYWLDTPPGNSLDDYFGVAFSTDGATFNEVYAHSSANASLSQMNTFYADLTRAARKPVVWVALTFVSNDDNLVGRGAFVKEVVLRGIPTIKTYFPLVRIDPSPTPQVSYLYSYTFGSGLNTDPQFLKWGGQMNYNCGADCTVIQSASTNGRPSGAVNFSVGGRQVIAGTSPNHTIPANFELTADLMLVEGKANARFGLIFGASNSTFYVDGDDGFTKMDALRNYYKFDLNIDPNDETAITQYRLQRYDNGSPINLQGGTNFPAGVVRGLGQWNTIRILRQGSNIQIYVNGYQAVNRNDSTFTGDRKFGVDLNPRELNNDNNPLKIRFDNIGVRQLP